jgi:hypothetical protein
MQVQIYGNGLYPAITDIETMHKMPNILNAQQISLRLSVKFQWVSRIALR